MNSIFYNQAETVLDIRCMTTDTGETEDLYSTIPLRITHSLYRQSNEDELHSSFEEAITYRVLALKKQHGSMNVPLTGTLEMQSSMSTVEKQQNSPTCLTFLSPGSRRAIRFIGIALMLIMVGFDLMGLLVLLKLP